VPVVPTEGRTGIHTLHGPRRARAVFVDRDGVINENRADHVKSWEEFHFLDRALGALARLAESDFKVVIATNQSAIGRQLVTRETVEEIHRWMLQRIVQAGGRIDLISYCPHHPEDGCPCRKPRPGLLIQASHDLDLDLGGSYLIGDSLRDIRAGFAVGCATILVRTGEGKEAIEHLGELHGRRPIIVEDLAEAVEWLLCREQAGSEE
jgi:D-glycero-D-manno-heptose 1,7-bisphosphate phosphatase